LRDPAIRDVAPHVLREVEQDGVDPAEIVEHLGVGIVRLDLGRDLVQLEPDRVLPVGALRVERSDEPAREAEPLRFGQCHHLSVVVGRGAAPFDLDGAVLERGHVPLEALGEHVHFLAEGRWCRGLPVRPGKHGRPGMRAGEGEDFLLHRLKGGKHYRLHGTAERQAMGGTVHVFRREREVHPFEHILEARSPELELYEILDRLHVVIGRGDSLISLSLELLDDVRVFQRDVGKGA
jgi:hypothetical protein